MELVKGVKYIIKKGNGTFNAGKKFEIDEEGYLYAYEFIRPLDIADTLDGCEYLPILEWCKASQKALMDELDILSEVIHDNK